jgi:hypothetical protein
MEIIFLEPLSRAVKRTRLALFTPFDLHKWFVIGFNAFLAGLADWSHGSGGSRGRGRLSFEGFLDFPRRAWAWLASHPGWFLAIAFIAIFVFIAGAVLLWLSSRGTFMFLDNVVRDKAEVAAPWRQYARAGNSLFVWRLVFGLIAFGLFAAFGIAFFATGASLYGRTGFDPFPIPWIALMAAVFLLLIVVVGYISLFLKDFVAPLMYKNGVPATRGWGQFLALFSRHPFHFIAYGLLVFVLLIAFVIIVIVAGLVTCCIGWFLLVIPYVGTVVTLPFWYALRAFSLEFLSQFGPDYALFPPAVVMDQSSAKTI